MFADELTPVDFWPLMQSHSNPLVSILIPAYNAEEWIAQSLTSAVQQTWRNKEIIVVDDGSTDATLAIARTFEPKGVRVFSQVNEGAAAARNAAFGLCSGDYIQWLDADDLLDSDKIERQILAASSYNDRRLLLSGAWGTFYARKERVHFIPTPLWEDLPPLEWLQRKMRSGVLFMAIESWLVSRELSEAAGPWDVRLLVDDDGEYFCRVILASNGTRFVPESRVRVRLTGTRSLSHIGRSPKKIGAQLLSCQLQVDRLRSVDDSEATREASRKYVEACVAYCRPVMLEDVARSKELLKSVGGKFELPELRWPYSAIQALVGAEKALGIKAHLAIFKIAVNRLLERAGIS